MNLETIKIVQYIRNDAHIIDRGKYWYQAIMVFNRLSDPRTPINFKFELFLWLMIGFGW